jgi:hypothetical protein
MVVPGVYKNETVITPGGGFTSGTLRVSRTGNIVSINIETALGFSSASTVTSATGIVPSWARPSSETQSNVYTAAVSLVGRASVTTAGTFSIDFRDWAGSTASSTSADRITLTYGVSDNLSAQISTTEAAFQTVRAVYEIDGATANDSFADNVYEIVDFNTKVIDTHNAVTTGGSWRFTAPKSGDYLISAFIKWINATNLVRTNLSVYKNGTVFKELADTIGAPSVRTNGSPITLPLNKGDYIEIYARQDDSASAARSINTAVSINYVSIIGLPDFSTFSVFGQSEVIESKATSTSAWPITAGNWGDLTNITLTPGIWKMTAHVAVKSTGGTPGAVLRFGCGISTTSGNSTTGLNAGDNLGWNTFPNSSGFENSVYVVDYEVTVTTPTTYYLKSFLSGTTNMIQQGHAIKARRIK